MERKLKAAVIGLTVGASHVTDYLKNPHIGEIVLCDTNPEKIAAVQAKTGLTKSYTDYREMLAAEKPDIVSVCVPNFLHKQVAADAMEAGCDVLSEKPLARTAEEGREIPEPSRRLTVRDAFVEAVLADTEVPCKPEQAIMISKIIDGVYESTRTGAPVKL